MRSQEELFEAVVNVEAKLAVDVKESVSQIKARLQNSFERLLADGIIDESVVKTSKDELPDMFDDAILRILGSANHAITRLNRVKDEFKALLTDLLEGTND